MPDEHVILATPAGRGVRPPAAPGEVVDLRHRILRAGLPRNEAVFAGDDDPPSAHVVAVLGEGGTIIGCATVHAVPWQGAPAWQLRGMATDPAVRGAGVGRAMLALLERLLMEGAPGVWQMWCNARVPAIGFYERLGWRVASEAFEIPTAGPHVQMTKRLPGGG
jgi:GNAT superfamily N-acetyltransferase